MYKRAVLQFSDTLFTEGNIGLMKAEIALTIDRGYKFSTYATWGIRQAAARGIADQGRTIRLRCPHDPRPSTVCCASPKEFLPHAQSRAHPHGTLPGNVNT